LVLEQASQRLQSRNRGYTIRDVPAATYEVRVWHEAHAERQLPVTVREGSVAPLDVMLPTRR